MKNSLPGRKSNSVTTCWGGRAGGQTPQGTVSQTQRSHGLLMCEWMNDRGSMHLMVKMDVDKSFPFHLCAGSNQKSDKPQLCCHHSSSPPCYPAQPSQLSIKTSQILRSLPITIPLLLDRNRSIRLQDARCRGTVFTSCLPEAHRSGVNPLSTKTITFLSSLHPPLCTHRGTDLINVSMWQLTSGQINGASRGVLWTSKDRQDVVDA